jgi:serine/threonine-protein phosphatase PP1 catalytic subunit
MYSLRFYDEANAHIPQNLEIFHRRIQLPPHRGHVASKIFCVHGGLSPSLTHMDEIRKSE